MVILATPMKMPPIEWPIDPLTVAAAVFAGGLFILGVSVSVGFLMRARHRP